MIPGVLIRKTYNSFLDEKKSESVCIGLCLTWLGDILKERPAQKMGSWFSGWLSGWFSPPLTPDKKASIPSDTVKLRLLLERAYRRHESYLKSCRESQQDPKHAVAAFRYNATEYFFLDPNLGLFKTSSSYPMRDITKYINKVYKEAVSLLEFIVSRRS